MDLVEGSDDLYIFFAGWGHEIGIPRYEFYNLSKTLHQSRIFVRDGARLWYQRGVKGIASNFHELAAWVHGFTNKYKRVICVGNSLGGYTALGVTGLIGGQAIVFGPRTSIAPWCIAGMRDWRHMHDLQRMWWATAWRRHMWDLVPVLNKGRAKAIVHVARGYDPDMGHAMRIADCPGVDLRLHDHGTHSLVRYLRDQGRLPAIMQERA